MSRRNGDLNELAWAQLFDDHAILEQIQQQGLFQISAEQIKVKREPRLMAKIDDSDQLPEIFRENRLGILPITRGSYLIGRIDLFHRFENTSPRPERITPVLQLESLDYERISSEALALNGAYSSGMLSQFLEEETLYPTISGRMGSSSFDFYISGDSRRYEISVDRAQMEIDGGYEGGDSIALVEAKNHLANDFLIRQLYYPFRRWGDIMHKPVRPIFLTYSNGIYHFREYTFQDRRDYNSIELLREARYFIETDSPQLTLQSIQEIIRELEHSNEDYHRELIIPQADDFGRVVNILEELDLAQDLGAAAISEQQHFTHRQSEYYANAAKFLGLVQKEEGRVQLTEEGKRIMRKDLHSRNIDLARAMLRPSFIRKAMKASIQRNDLISKEEISAIMRAEGVTDLSDSTVLRRAQTVRAWLKWLLDNTVED